jgi:2,3-bisphosphoglycerate-independent phosphoglycerate mutase
MGDAVISSEHTRKLWIGDSEAKIVLLVIDGLGGLPHPDTGKSELEAATLPNLDRLAATGSSGSISPLGPGFTPGSGPAHLALFGYDPWENEIGRGALSALGLGMEFASGDVAARLNFCTVDGEGRVTDRRAGRIPTAKCRELCSILEAVSIPDVTVTIAPEMDYRAAVVFRGQNLSDAVTDSDPQVTGVRPRPLEARTESARATVDVANAFLDQATQLLATQSPANMVLIRGFGGYPALPRMEDVYGLKALAIAGYPMYRGVARAVGMQIVETSSELASEFDALRANWDKFDFFYVHVKKTDSAGEDGDFEGKTRLLEDVDTFVGQILGLAPEVLVVTGDHSTPSIMKSHSWHPVPLLISSPWVNPVGAQRGFSEKQCATGDLGQIPSTAVMALALAHARRLSKFGA